MERILALDIGDRRIGVAVSDPLQITAQGLETYTRTDSVDEDINYLIKLAKSYAPVKIVFGMPRNMNGTYGPQAEKVKEFSNQFLKHWNGPYDFYDERLTTVSAERFLISQDVRRDKRKQVIDKMAAQVILRDYMEFSKNNTVK